MKTYFGALSMILTVMLFSSCQKTIDWELPDSVLDSTEHITPMFRIVQVDVASTRRIR